MQTSQSFHLLLTREPEDELWKAQWIDAGGRMLPDCPTFYSRYSLWAKAHALTWYAEQLYNIKKTTTPVD